MLLLGCKKIPSFPDSVFIMRRLFRISSKLLPNKSLHFTVNENLVSVLLCKGHLCHFLG